MYAKRHSTTVLIPAPASDVFALVDDHARLASHMSERSWAMGGGSMSVQMDSGQGKTVGSRLWLHGVVCGLRLSVEEAVVQRTPPFRKVWETIGEPRLLVVGRYRMGFEIESLGPSSRLTVFIDYDRPSEGASFWLGVLFGGWYAKWCTERMASDAARLIAMPFGRSVTHQNPVMPRQAATDQEVTMEKLNPWRTGAALALCVAILNVVCAIVVYASPESVIAFANSWWHGLDLGLIRSDKPWTPGGLLLGLFNAAATGFAAGAVFAGCYNLVARRQSGGKQST